MNKGQSRYLVGVAVMVFAVTFYSLGNFAVKFVLNSAIEDMDQNFDRYESAVHSYTILNDGEDQMANVINQTELANDVHPYTSDGYTNLCYSDEGIPHGERYKLWFMHPFRSVRSDDACTPSGWSSDSYSGSEKPGWYYPGVTSLGLIRMPRIFPVVQFYGTANGGKVFYMQTRVK